MAAKRMTGQRMRALLDVAERGERQLRAELGGLIDLAALGVATHEDVVRARLIDHSLAEYVVARDLLHARFLSGTTPSGPEHVPLFDDPAVTKVPGFD